jgi:sec-independent protein translocase protein TatA
MIIIFGIVLLLFGAKKLPELAKGLGQAVREFSKAKDDIENEIHRPPSAAEPQRLAEPKVETPRDTQPVDSNTKVV